MPEESKPEESKPELKYCPFCSFRRSGVQAICVDEDEGWWIVRCNGCDAQTGRKWGREAAVNAWNERIGDEKTSVHLAQQLRTWMKRANEWRAKGDLGVIIPSMDALLASARGEDLDDPEGSGDGW